MAEPRNRKSGCAAIASSRLSVCDSPPIRLTGSAARRVSASAARRAFGPARGRSALQRLSQLVTSRLAYYRLELFSSAPVDGRLRRSAASTPKARAKLINNVNTGSIDAPLQSADIGPVNLRAMRQLLLRQALRPPELSQIDCQYLCVCPYARGTVLKSISPRSILDKRSQRCSCCALKFDPSELSSGELWDRSRNWRN